VGKDDNAGSTTFTQFAKLALQLHQQGEYERRMKLPDGVTIKAEDLPPDCRFKDDELEFTTITARNEAVATGVLEQLSPNADATALFDAAYKLWGHEIGHADQASGRLLALVADRIDILAAGTQRIRSGVRVYDVLHLIEATIPYLNSINAKSIIDLANASHGPTKNDMAGNPVYGVLETWLDARPNQALALHAQVLEHLNDETKVLLVVAILALSKSDYTKAVEVAREDGSSQVQLRAEAGVWALGRLLLVEQAPQESIKGVEEAVIEVINGNRGELKFHALSAATGAMHKIPAFDSVLEQLAEESDQQVLALGARVLFFKSDQMRERGLTPRWLQLLTKLKPEFEGALRDLDYAMSRLLAVPENVEIVVSMLTKWVENHGQTVAVDSHTAELFDSTIRRLLQHSEPWSLLVTDWLLSDQKAHPRVLAGILNQLNDSHTALRLDKGRIDQLSAIDLVFLARRMLGYVHDRAQLTSLSLSLLQANDAEGRIYPMLRDVLVNQIGYDYPGSTMESLREAAEASASEKDKGFLFEVVDEIDQAIAARASLPRLSELHPSPKLRQLLARARAKQMDASYEKAQEKSVFSQMVTRIPLKAGSGTFSYRDSNFDPPMKLSSASISFELPQREALDPIGNAMRLYQFRNAKRGEQ
jgi:hypothetical protein